MHNSPRVVIRESLSDRWLLVSLYVFLSIVFLLVAYPIVYIFSSSFSSASAVIGGKVWLWPVQPTWFGYKAVFDYSTVWSGYLNSIIYVIAGSLLSVTLSIMFAYPLSVKTFYGRKLFIWALLFAMMFSGGLIPFYLVVKSLGLIGTRWAIILPSALNIFSVIIAKTFFQSTIPKELYEASQLDGCRDTAFLLRVVLPLSKPIIAVLLMWAAVFQWNSYFNALIFLDNEDVFPLQLILREILVLNQASMSAMTMTPEELQRFEDMKTLLKYSVIIVSSVPMLLLYPLAQKYFVKGVMIGSVKE